MLTPLDSSRVRRAPRRRGRGFTLLEILVAMFIFAVGFATLAAVFPAGALMQKVALEEIESEQVARGVQAMIQARKFKHPNLDAAIPPNSLEFTAYSGDWDDTDRSMPGLPLKPGYYPKYSWRVLVRRIRVPTGPSDWQVAIFVLRKAPDAGSDPNVASTEINWWNQGLGAMAVTSVGTIVVGSQVMDNNGVTYKVINIEKDKLYFDGKPLSFHPAKPTKLWYGPIMRVLVLSDAVE